MQRSALLAIILASVLFGFLSSYNIAVLSGVMIFLESDFTLTTLHKSLLIGSFLFSAIMGALFGGPVADRYGRKRALVIIGLIYVMGGVILSFTSSLEWMIFAQGLMGMGAGASTVVFPIYLTEVAGRDNRGLMVCIFQLAVVFGIVASYCVNLCMAGSSNWRGCFIIGFVIAVLALLTLIPFKESPRWPIEEEKGESFKSLFAGYVKRALIIGVVLSLLQQWTGINTITYYGPEIFHRAGMTGLYAKLLATFGIGVVNILSTIFALFAIDRFGRRSLLLWGSASMALFLLLLSAFPTTPAIAFLSVTGYVIAFAVSLGPVLAIISAELLPTRVRGKGLSLIMLVNWLANFLLSAAFPFLIEWLGISPLFSLFGALSLLTFIFVYYKVPETKGKTLEEIQTTFSLDAEPNS